MVQLGHHFRRWWFHTAVVFPSKWKEDDGPPFIQFWGWSFINEKVTKLKTRPWLTWKKLVPVRVEKETGKINNATMAAMILSIFTYCTAVVISWFHLLWQSPQKRKYSWKIFTRDILSTKIRENMLKIFVSTKIEVPIQITKLWLWHLQNRGTWPSECNSISTVGVTESWWQRETMLEVVRFISICYFRSVGWFH